MQHDPILRTEFRRRNGVPGEPDSQTGLFRALHEMAVAVAGAPDVPALARTVVEHACGLAGADTGALYLWNDERVALVPVAVWNIANDALPQAVLPGDGVTGRAFAQRVPIVVADYAHGDDALHWDRGEGLRTLASIPLVVAEQPFGCFTIGFFAPHACGEDMVRQLQLVATPGAAAIETMRLLEAYRRSERALREVTATLEQKVIDRTTQLESAVRELEAFSYSVSHDLRSPLRSISSYSQILLRDHLDGQSADAQDCLRRVSNASQRMGHLIDDLLQFARLGRHALTRRTVAMGPLAQQVIDDLADECAGRTIEFDVAELPPCYGDLGLLRQVFANLIDNAVKYTRRRAVARIMVGSHVEGDEVIFSVKDNGAGFDMRYADKLFGVFQRLHRAAEYEGTGVGLANVQRIIHRHGGRVWADAAVDHGAAFFFTIGKEQPDAE